MLAYTLFTGDKFSNFYSTIFAIECESTVYTCFNEMREGRKKEASKVKQTRQSNSTPKVVTFPKKNELPQVGLESTTLYTLDRALYH